MSATTPSLRLSSELMSRRSSTTFTLATTGDLVTGDGDLFDLDISHDAGGSDAGGMFGSSLFAEIDALDIVNQPASRHSSNLIPRRQRRRSSVGPPIIISNTSPTNAASLAPPSNQNQHFSFASAAPRSKVSPRWRRLRVLIRGAIRFCQCLREIHMSPYHTSGDRLIEYLCTHASTDITGVGPAARLLKNFCEESSGQASVFSSSTHITSLVKCLQAISRKLRIRAGLPAVPYGNDVNPSASPTTLDDGMNIQRQVVGLMGGSCQTPKGITTIIQEHIANNLDHEAHDGCLRLPAQPLAPWSRTSERSASLAVGRTHSLFTTNSAKHFVPPRSITDCAASISAALVAILRGSSDARAIFVSRCDLLPCQAPLDGALASCLLAHGFQPQVAVAILSAGCAAEADVTFAEMGDSIVVDGYYPLSPLCIDILQLYGISNNLLVVCAARDALTSSFSSSTSASPTSRRVLVQLKMAGQCIGASIAIHSTLLAASYKAAPSAIKVAAGALYAAAMVAELIRWGVITDTSMSTLYGDVAGKASELATRAHQDAAKTGGAAGQEALDALRLTVEAILSQALLPKQFESLSPPSSGQTKLLTNVAVSLGAIVRGLPAGGGGKRLAAAIASLGPKMMNAVPDDVTVALFTTAIEWVASTTTTTPPSTPHLAVAALVDDSEFIPTLLRTRGLSASHDTIVALLSVLPSFFTPSTIRAVFQLTTPILELFIRAPSTPFQTPSDRVPFSLILQCFEALASCASGSSWTAVMEAWLRHALIVVGRMEGIHSADNTTTSPQFRSTNRRFSAVTASSFEFSLEATPRRYTFPVGPHTLLQVVLDTVRIASSLSHDIDATAVSTIGSELFGACVRDTTSTSPSSSGVGMVVGLPTRIYPQETLVSTLATVSATCGAAGLNTPSRVLYWGATAALSEAALRVTLLESDPPPTSTGDEDPCPLVSALSRHVSYLVEGCPLGRFEAQDIPNLLGYPKLAGISALVQAVVEATTLEPSFGRTPSLQSEGTFALHLGPIEAYAKLLKTKGHSALWRLTAVLTERLGHSAFRGSTMLLPLAISALHYGLLVDQNSDVHEGLYSTQHDPTVDILIFVEAALKAWHTANTSPSIPITTIQQICALATTWADVVAGRAGGSIRGVSGDHHEMGWGMVSLGSLNGPLPTQMAHLRSCIRLAFQHTVSNQSTPTSSVVPPSNPSLHYVDVTSSGSEQLRYLLLQLASSTVVTRIFSLPTISEADKAFWTGFVEGVVVKREAEDAAESSTLKEELVYVIGKMRAAEASSALWCNVVEARSSIMLEQQSECMHLYANSIAALEVLRPPTMNLNTTSDGVQDAAGLYQKIIAEAVVRSVVEHVLIPPTTTDVCVGTECTVGGLAEDVPERQECAVPTEPASNPRTDTVDASCQSEQDNAEVEIPPPISTSIQTMTVLYCSASSQCTPNIIPHCTDSNTQCDVVSTRSHGTQSQEVVMGTIATQVDDPHIKTISTHTQCHPPFELPTLFSVECLAIKGSFIHGGGTVSSSPESEMCIELLHAYKKLCSFITDVLSATSQTISVSISEDSYAEALRVKTVRLADVERRLRDSDEVLADALEPHVELQPLLGKMQRLVRDRNAALARMERDVERLVDVWRRKVDVQEMANKQLIVSERELRKQVSTLHAQIATFKDSIKTTSIMADGAVQCDVLAVPKAVQTEHILPPEHMVSDRYISKRGIRQLHIGDHGVEEMAASSVNSVPSTGAGSPSSSSDYPTLLSTTANRLPLTPHRTTNMKSESEVHVEVPSTELMGTSPSKHTTPTASPSRHVGHTATVGAVRGVRDIPPTDNIHENPNPSLSSGANGNDLLALRRQVRKLESQITRLTTNMEVLASTPPKQRGTTSSFSPPISRGNISPIRSNPLRSSSSNGFIGDGSIVTDMDGLGSVRRKKRNALRRAAKPIIRYSTPPPIHHQHAALIPTMNLPHHPYNSEGRRRRYGELAPLPLPKLAFDDIDKTLPSAATLAANRLTPSARRPSSAHRADTVVTDFHTSSPSASQHQRFYNNMNPTSYVSGGHTSPSVAPLFTSAISDRPFEVTPIRRNANFGRMDARLDIAHVTAPAAVSPN